MKKQTSIFLVILLCMLVAVAAGGTSYLVLANAHDQETQSLNDQIDRLETQVTKLQKEAKSATTAKTTTTPTTTENTTTATTTTDPTAEWKTYTDTINGITFKYPTDATIVPSNRAISIKQNDDKIINFIVFSKSEILNGATKYSTVEDFAKGMANPNTFAQTTLGGQTAYDLIANGLGNVNCYEIYSEHNSKVYNFEISSNIKSLSTDQKSILSSFKYTN